MLAKGRLHSQVINKTTPAIETADYGTNQATLAFGHQEQVGIALELLLDFFGFIRAADVNARTGVFPEQAGRRVILRILEFP